MNEKQSTPRIYPDSPMPPEPSGRAVRASSYPEPRILQAGPPQVPTIMKQKWYVELEMETEGVISLFEALEKIKDILELPKYYGAYKFAGIKTRLKSIWEV